MHTAILGQIISTKMQNDQNPTCHFWEAKSKNRPCVQALHTAPPEGWADCLSPPSTLTSEPAPYLPQREGATSPKERLAWTSCLASSISNQELWLLPTTSFNFTSISAQRFHWMTESSSSFYRFCHLPTKELLLLMWSTWVSVYCLEGLPYGVMGKLTFWSPSAQPLAELMSQFQLVTRRNVSTPPEDCCEDEAS